MAHHIPFFDYSREYEMIRNDITKAVDDVCRSGQLILGKQVKAFEEEFAAFTGAKFAVGLNSGTDAISLALMAFDIGHDDEVVTVANTAVATVSAIRAVGAIPRFVDVDPETLLLDVNKVAPAITGKTKAIVPVHLYGNSVDITALKAAVGSKNIAIIEDCAHAHGSKQSTKDLGTLGDIGCFSFYPTKTIGAYGDAGICITDNAELYSKLKKLRMYGFDGQPIANIEGRNSRLDELHAAILRVKLKAAPEFLKRRRDICTAYSQGIKNSHLKLIKTTAATQVLTNHLFVVRTSDRDGLMKHLEKHGIGFGTHYRYPIHLMPAYQFLGYKPDTLPATETNCNQVLSLPLFPTMTDTEVQHVIKTLNDFVPMKAATK